MLGAVGMPLNGIGHYINVSQILRKRNGNISGEYRPLNKGIAMGTNGWPEKRQRGQPSLMSPLREGKSWRTVKVKPGPAPAPQCQVDGFAGPMC